MYNDLTGWEPVSAGGRELSLLRYLSGESVVPSFLRIAVFCSFFVVLTPPQTRGATFHLLDMGTGLSSPHVVTVDGIQMTLSDGGVFNSTASSFGIDQSNPSDDPNLIDGVEILFLIFDQDVFLDSILISNFEGQDNGYLDLKSTATFPLASGIINVGGIRLKAGSTDYRVGASNGGFSLDQVTVRAVPEPTVLGIALVGLMGLACRRCRG